MRLVGMSLSLFILPVVLVAQTMQPLPNQLDAQNVHNFFSALDAVIAGKPSTNKIFDDFIAKSKASTDLKGYWDDIFKEYIKAGEDFVRSKGMKLSYTDDAPSIQKAMELRKLHQKLKPLAKAPASESQIYIFPSAQTAANLDSVFGAGTAEKVGITKERTVHRLDRVYKFEKDVVAWEIKKMNGKIEKIIATFEDKTTKDFLIPEEMRKDNAPIAVEILRRENAIYLPGAPLKSTEVGSKRAIVSLKDGSFEFRDTLGTVTSENKIIMVDNADAAFEAATKSVAPKKTSFKPTDDLLEFVVPALHPKVCST